MLISEQKTKELYSIISSTNPVFQSRISSEFVHKSNSDQVLIGNIQKLNTDTFRDFFEPEIDDINSIFHCKAYPNLECEVCFDHPLDHYPLMMIFEIGRQIGIAASHKFYDIPLEGYISIVESLTFDFKTFLELDKPVYIVCVDSDIKDKKGLSSRHLDLIFIQEGMYCASGKVDVRIFKKRLYERMRLSSRKKVADDAQASYQTIPTNTILLNNFFPASVANS